MVLLRVAALAVVLLSPAGSASPALEQQVKAAFLFRFLSFVEWPTTAAPVAAPAPPLPAPPLPAAAALAAGPPLVVGIVGNDAVQAELRQMVAGRTVNERPVVVEGLKEGERPGPMHVVFVGRQAGAQLRRLAPAPAAVLTVAEWDGALEHGAVINFVVSDGRVRFEVALDEAERRGLRLNARLLAVALNVRGGPARP